MPVKGGTIATARRAVLVLAALVFAAVAVASLVAPHATAASFGYTLANVDALSEFRAVYVGVWLATAVLLVVAANRIEQLILGDLAAVIILGQSAGRILSLVLDGVPSGRIWPFFVLELIGGLLLLLLRPRAAVASRPFGAKIS